MLRMSIEERRTRLGTRHALARDARVKTPVDAAAAVVALHGTDAASVYLSALARMRTGDVDAVATALYDDRELLRVLAMRRTMFVAPVDTAAVLLAACSQTVAARERRKLIGYLEAAGLADDVDGWLAGAEQAALDALAKRGEATAPEIAADDPRLATKIVLGGKELPGDADRRQPRSHRARRPGQGHPHATGRRLDVDAVLLGAPGRLARRRRTARARARAHRARPPLAAALRAGERRRPALVDRLERRRDPQGAGRARHGRGRPRRHAGDRAGRRCRARRRHRPVGRAPARARRDDDGLEGTRLVPRRPPRAALRPQRQRVADRVVRRPHRRRLGPGARRRDPHPPARRRRRRRHVRRSTRRPPS